MAAKRRERMALAVCIGLLVVMVGAGPTGASGQSGTARRAAATGLDDPAKEIGRRDGSSLAPTMRPAGVAGGFVYVPITPFRALDTRAYTDGFLLGGDEIYFDVLTDANGASRVPSNAVAVTYNLTVAGSYGSGFLSVYPGNAVWPGTSSVNWQFSGQVLANGGTVAIGTYTSPGQVVVYCGPDSDEVGTNFVLDVTGYFI